MGDEAFRELSKVDPDGGKLLDDVSGCTFIFFLVRDTCRIQFSFHAECFWRSKLPRLAKESNSVFKAHLVPWVEFSSLTLGAWSRYLLWQRTLALSVCSPYK